jgi:hypothetical protein
VVEKVALGQSCPQVFQVLPANVIPPVLHSHLTSGTGTINPLEAQYQPWMRQGIFGRSVGAENLPTNLHLSYRKIFHNRRINFYFLIKRKLFNKSS